MNPEDPTTYRAIVTTFQVAVLLISAAIGLVLLINPRPPKK